MNLISRFIRLVPVFAGVALATATLHAGQPCGNNSSTSPAGKNGAAQSPDDGDPFTPYTGNEYRKIPDLKVWGGVGQFQLTFTRWANSRFVGGAQYFGNGHNWRHNYQWDIADTTASGTGAAQIEIIAPEGSDTIFTQGATTPANWAPPSTITDTLTQAANGTDFYLVRKSGLRYHIVKTLNADGSDYYLMTDFTDTQGNDYVLTYDAAHKVTQVTEPGGRYIRINYTTVPLNSMPFSTLATITSTPAGGAYTTMTVTDPHAYRYLLYRSPDGGYCNVSEIQFYDTGGNLISGTPFGTSPAYENDANTYVKAFDGSTGSFFDYSQASGGFCGIDLGAGNAAVVGSIRFYPRANFAYRMMPSESWLTHAQFQGGNQAPVALPVISSVTTGDGRTVTYNYTSYADPTLPVVYQTLTSVNYDDGTSATYAYQQTMPGTPPLVSAFNDPRYELPFTQSKSTYYAGVDQAVGEIENQINPQTGEALYTLSTSNDQPIVTNGGNATRLITMNHTTGHFWQLTDATGVVTSRNYDSYGYVKDRIDGLGHTTVTVNSSADHPLSITHPDATKITYTRDSEDLPLTVTDELGRTTTITRDASHRPTQIAYADGSSESYTYNAFNQPLTHTLRNGGTTSATYDSTGLKTSSTDPLGHVTTYTYDAQGRVATVTDPLGHTTSYGYDARSDVTLVTHADGSTHAYTYDTYGNKLTETDELGHVTTWTYDVLNRCTRVTDPLGRVTQYVFRSGYYTTNPDQVIDPAGKVTAYTYDAEQHLLTQTTAYGTADAATTTYAYDANYNVTSVTDGNGHATTYAYDNRNRRISATDALGNVTKYAYDAAGNMTKTTRPDGGITTNVYDKVHHLLTTTDPKGQITTMTYDLAGNLLTRTDAKGNVYTYTYDALNRVTSLAYPDGTHESYGYDAAGNLVTYTNRAGATRTSVFDNRNREISYTWSDGTPGVTRTYDAAGHLLTSANNVSTSAYTYDAASQLLSETQTNASLGAPWPVDYTYDADGNRASVTYPSGLTLAYAYTNRNQVSSLGSSGLSAPSSQLAASYTYDSAGNVLTKTLADGTTATSTYDADNRLTNLNHALGGASLAQFTYAYDVDSRRTSEQRDSAVADTYTYDAVDQVTGVDYGSGRTVGYAYDATGNRQSVTDSVNGNTAYATNNLNQYTSVAAAYGYDQNGNLVSGNGLYIYDAQNRLGSASVGGNVDSFFYDSKNRVVERIINGAPVYLIYDGWNLIEERDSSGNLVNTYIHGAGTDEMLSKTDASGNTVYYHANALGSTADLTNASGTVVESYTYDVFGRPTITDGSGNPLTASAYGNRFLFTGREWLAEVSLYDYRNRVYSADLGRFLQTDPMSFSAGDMNIYRYCENNPMNAFDPDGRQPIPFSAFPGMGSFAGVPPQDLESAAEAQAAMNSPGYQAQVMQGQMQGMANYGEAVGVTAAAVGIAVALPGAGEAIDGAIMAALANPTTSAMVGGTIAAVAILSQSPGLEGELDGVSETGEAVAGVLQSDPEAAEIAENGQNASVVLRAIINAVEKVLDE